jgi:hypothetical protein
VCIQLEALSQVAALDYDVSRRVCTHQQSGGVPALGIVSVFRASAVSHPVRRFFAGVVARGVTQDHLRSLSASLWTDYNEEKNRCKEDSHGTPPQCPEFRRIGLIPMSICNTALS